MKGLVTRIGLQPGILRRAVWHGGALAGLACIGLTGCDKLHRAPAADYVYVTAKQTYLRDRTAAVSNRTATVTNGQRLKVLEKSRHWIHVTTDNAETGWIDDKTVVNQATYDQVTSMRDQHQKDPTISTGTVRDEVNLHIAPGRDTDHFFRLGEGDKVQVLQRATLPRGGNQAPKPAAAANAKPGPPEPPPMEDWWLVRDPKGGRTGWMLARMMDVDEPDALLRYAEGQRIVGSYVLTTVNDPDAPGDIKDVPVYVSVFAPFKAGLPYDFDQIRVFTWNRAKHRYETGFRERNIEGYLPVTIATAKDPSQKSQLAGLDLPTFTVKVLSGETPLVVPDPKTGMITPGKLISKTYRLEGNIVRRIDPPTGVATNEAHPTAEEKKAEPKKKRRK